MTALTKDRATPIRSGASYSFPVAAAVVCYAGAIAVLDAAGHCKPAVAATGLIAVGRFEEHMDNAAGAAGDEIVEVLPGIFRYANSGGADEITAAEIGDSCWLVDDQTVAATDAAATRSVAGTVMDVDGNGVWVRIGH